MNNYYYYIEVKHDDSIISPVSKVIIKPEDIPNYELIPDIIKEQLFTAYAYDIFTKYRANKQWYHYTLRVKYNDDCIHQYTTYPGYKAFSNLLGFDPEQKEQKTA